VLLLLACLDTGTFATWQEICIDFQLMLLLAKYYPASMTEAESGVLCRAGNKLAAVQQYARLGNQLPKRQRGNVHANGYEECGGWSSAHCICM
jgi:hypothetical protein